MQYFSELVSIFIQGKPVAITVQEVLEDVAIITVEQNPDIIIYDHRPKSLEALKRAIQNGDTSKVIRTLIRHAWAKVAKFDIDGDEHVSIHLYPPSEEQRRARPNHAIWISVGIDGEIPLYDYICINIYAMGEKKDKFSLFTFFKRHRKRKKENHKDDEQTQPL